MSDPSEKAALAAAEECYPEVYHADVDVYRIASVALEAAHHPSLGLDRSVCLRDVFTEEFRARHPHAYDYLAVTLLPAFECEFGGGTDG